MSQVIWALVSDFLCLTEIFASACIMLRDVFRMYLKPIVFVWLWLSSHSAPLLHLPGANRRSRDPAVRKAGKAISFGRATIARATFGISRFDPLVIDSVERTRLALEDTEAAYRRSIEDPRNIVKIMQVLRAADELEFAAEETLTTARLGSWFRA